MYGRDQLQDTSTRLAESEAAMQAASQGVDTLKDALTALEQRHHQVQLQLCLCRPGRLVLCSHPP